MKMILSAISIVLITLFGVYNSGFREQIKFNHLFVVIDDSTYKYLLDSLKLPENFAKTSEQITNTSSGTWTGIYIQGLGNYLEIFKPSSIKGATLGDVGIGFMTNKLGTIDLLQDYWAKKLDSVHVENKLITADGKTTPWYKSVSIPNINSLKISAWVMENTKEELDYAGFTKNDLSGKIEYSEYLKHIRAKTNDIPVDSVKNDRLFNKITSLDLCLSREELAYLDKFLVDMGFTKKNNSFSKDDFIINYSLTVSKHFLLKKIAFSLTKKIPKEKHSFKKIEMIVAGDQAIMNFKY